MEYVFVLKDKGTHNQGWWLKIDSIEKLADYYEKTLPSRQQKILDNYIYGKEFNPKAKGHSPHLDYEPVTQAVIMHADGKNYNIFQAMSSFYIEIASAQMESIRDYGCIFINRVGGYHADYDGVHKYDFIRRKKLVFPTFKKDDIRIKQFNGGQHFYAYIDDVQVRDGDTLKWDSYEEAYKKAKDYIC